MQALQGWAVVDGAQAGEGAQQAPVAKGFPLQQLLHGRAPFLQLQAGLGQALLAPLFPLLPLAGQLRPMQGQLEGQLV